MSASGTVQSAPSQPARTPPTELPTSPNLGVMAMIYVGLFILGLIAVSAFVTRPSFPSPDASPGAIVAYFEAHPTPVRVSAFLSFGGILALTILVGAVASRFRLWGLRSAWVDIALLLGLMTALDQAVSHLCEWTLTWPGVTHSAPLTLALFYLLYALGGPGFSLPMGLFVGSLAGIGAKWSLLPGWLVWIGFVITAMGVISWLNLLAPSAPLISLTIPLTRFPAFAWLIVAGFALPKTLPARIS